MEFRLLGPLEALVEDRALQLAGGKQRALLAVLLLRANETVSTDRLIDELWGDGPPASAGKIVQVYVSHLRKALGEGILLTRAPGYLLQIEPDALDIRHFERLLEEARRRLAGGEPAQARPLLEDALRLWRGPPLAEFAYEDFAQAEIARLEELRLAALEERIETDLALGRHADVVPELEALVGKHPLRERLRGQLMLALYRSGRQAEALAAYQSARRLLAEELGLEPSEPLQRLEKAILDHEAELGEPTPARTATLAPRVVTIMSVVLPEPAREAAAEHVRSEVERHGGREVTTVGVPAAIFESARAAVSCAAAVRTALAGEADESQPGIGLTLGELTGGAEHELPLDATTSIAETAGPGGVLVTDAVKLLAGRLPHLSFRERGEFEIAGFPERFRLHEVAQREQPGRAREVLSEPPATWSARRLLRGRRTRRDG
jgi:DNA-binding SARP family transcriptional activator